MDKYFLLEIRFSEIAGTSRQLITHRRRPRIRGLWLPCRWHRMSYLYRGSRRPFKEPIPLKFSIATSTGCRGSSSPSPRRRRPRCLDGALMERLTCGYHWMLGFRSGGDGASSRTIKRQPNSQRVAKCRPGARPTPYNNLPRRIPGGGQNCYLCACCNNAS